MRIWYQSFTDRDLHSLYLTRLESYLAEIALPGTEVTVGGLSPGPVAHPVSELRCSVQVLDSLCAAESDAYDGVIIGHFQEAGLEAARAMLDIPVVGLGEASMLYAMQLGRRFGLVSIDPIYRDWHRDQASRLGLADRLVGVEGLGASVEAVVAALDDPAEYGRLREKFVEEAGKLADAGAEVIISAGGLFALASAHEQRFRVGEAVVLNPIPVAVRNAETAIWLRNHNGTEPSRAGAYAKPSELAVSQLRDLANGRLPRE